MQRDDFTVLCLLSSPCLLILHKRCGPHSVSDYLVQSTLRSYTMWLMSPKSLQSLTNFVFAVDDADAREKGCSCQRPLQFVFFLTRQLAFSRSMAVHSLSTAVYLSPVTLRCLHIGVPVCPVGTFGQDCSGSCQCNTQNSIFCDHVSGTCNCTVGWEGDACDIDIDECAAPSSVTCPARSDCVNTAGGHVCACETGFYKDSSGLCQGERHV